MNANTLIGAAILKSGHPYIWATLPRAHNYKHDLTMYAAIPMPPAAVLVVELKEVVDEH